MSQIEGKIVKILVLASSTEKISKVMMDDDGGSRLVLWWSRRGWVDRTGVKCTDIAVSTLWY